MADRRRTWTAVQEEEEEYYLVRERNLVLGGNANIYLGRQVTRPP
jgi:hypothetical protein